MLDNLPSPVGEAGLLAREWIGVQVAESAVAFALDQRRAIREGLLHKFDHSRFGLVVGSFGVAGGRLHTSRRIDEVVVCSGGVQELFGKRPLGWGRFEEIFVLGEVLGHRRELSPDVVPVVKQNLRRTRWGLGCRVLLWRVLGSRYLNAERGSQDKGKILAKSSHAKISFESTP